MIAHRLKTVRHADKIYVIENGKIAQKGTHEELSEQEGIYRNFVMGRQEGASWKIASTWFSTLFLSERKGRDRNESRPLFIDEEKI